MRAKEFLSEMWPFDSKPKAPPVDWNVRAKELFAKGFNEQQVRAQLLKEGCPPKQVDVYVQGGQLEEAQQPKVPQKPRQGPLRTQTGGGAHKDKTKTIPRKEKHKNAEIAEHGKASYSLCTGSKPDSELGASNLASCKSQGLRARTGNKSHLMGKGPKSRMTMGGHKVKGKKYGGPIPDWS